MPSRLGVTLIAAFWLATTGYVVYRDVIPRYFADAPPSVLIDLVDEATTPLAAVRWTITRAGQPLGTLVTRTEYVAADDTFRFVTSYTNLRFDAGAANGQFVTLEVPSLNTTVRVDRKGALREQSMQGKLVVKLGPLELGDATADVSGVVVNGQLVGRCAVRSSASAPTIDRELDPVPVPAGQVLNPMMPVHRLQGVHPGRRWVIREVNPLNDAIVSLLRELSKQSPLIARALPNQEARELVAEVARVPEVVTRTGIEPVECWVITYRTDEIAARTWVGTADGRVVRQEAVVSGEAWRFDRTD